MKKILLCKKSINIYTLVFAGVVMGLMSFVSSPQKEEIIKGLREDYKMILSDLKTWQKIAVKAINGRRAAEQKVKGLEKELSLQSVPVAKPEPEVIRIERKLNHYDSLTIATVMMKQVMRPEDSLAIHVGYVLGHWVKGKGGVKVFQGK